MFCAIFLPCASKVVHLLLPCPLPSQDPYTPFTTMAWVNSSSDFVAALQSNLPNIVMVYNVSLPPDIWPEGGPIQPDHDIVIAGWPSRKTIIDWQVREFV